MVIIKTDVVASEVPLLLSRSAMKTAQMKLNFEDDQANIFGVDVDLEATASGHCCLKLEGETAPKENNVTFCNKLKEKYKNGRIDGQKNSLYSDIMQKAKKTSYINQSRTNGPINAHVTIAQVMPRYNHNNEKQEALL